MTQAAMHAGY